jgi:hypothetical protein
MLYDCRSRKTLLRERLVFQLTQCPEILSLGLEGTDFYEEVRRARRFHSDSGLRLGSENETALRMALEWRRTQDLGAASSV